MIGENIKRIRRSRGLTQQMMAEKMHVNQNTISSWETNRTEPVRVNFHVNIGRKS